MTSVGYYDTNAQAYFDATVHADVSALRARFLRHVKPGARILDAGCGSGRDLKAFATAGYNAVGMDASAELAARARAFSERAVIVTTFEEMDFAAEFDAIWACASLLHVARTQLPDVLQQCARALHPGGILYVSLKHGGETRIDGARTFTDVAEPELRQKLTEAGFDVVEMWVTDDVRPGRADQWINSIARLK